MITNFNQELWGDLILEGTKTNSAFASIAARYEGKVNGDKVHFPKIGDVNINTYTKDTPITTQVLSDSEIVLDLNQQKYFSFMVDDIDKAQSDLDILSMATMKGTRAMAKTLDTYIAGLHAGAGLAIGNDTTPTAINSVNVQEQLLLAARKLIDAGANPEDLWAVIPPWVWQDLTKADEAVASNNSEIMANGFLGSRYGFKIYRSTNVHFGAGDKCHIMMGDADAFRHAVQIDKVETLRSEETFGDIVRGLFVFGAKVTYSGTLLTLTATEAAEA